MLRCQLAALSILCGTVRSEGEGVTDKTDWISFFLGMLTMLPPIVLIEVVR